MKRKKKKEKERTMVWKLEGYRTCVKVGLGSSLSKVAPPWLVTCLSIDNVIVRIEFLSA